MSKHTMIVRGVLPVAVAVASLLTPFATAVASEPSLTGDDATAADASLDGSVDDVTSTTTETTDEGDGTLDGSGDSTEDDGTVLDDTGDLTDTVEDLLDEGEDVTDATASEVDRVVAPDEGSEGGQDEGETDPPADDGSEQDEATSGEAEDDAGDQPAASNDPVEADRKDQRPQAPAPVAAAGERSPVPPPASAWNGERAEMYEELLGGFDDEPLLAPRTKVDRLQDAPPPELRVGMADLDYRPSLGQRSTAKIMDILRRTRALPSTTARIMAPFPVAGLAGYSDDWGAPRHPDRVHRGVDIFADRGTPVIASMDGVISGLRHHQGLGGNWLRLEAPDGTYLYYAHLEGFAEGIEQGVSVVRGQVLGTVGTSGNAQFTPPHLHLQIHPGGGAPVPPLPYLDQWLDQAYQAALAYEASNGGIQAPQVAPPATVETSASSAAPGSEAPAPTAPAVVGTERSHGLDRASTSSGGPAALGMGVIGVIVWVMLHRPRRRDEEETDGFIDLGVPPPTTNLPLRLDVPDILELPTASERSDRELVGARTP